MPYINDKTPGPIHSQPLVPNKMEPLKKPDVHPSEHHEFQLPHENQQMPHALPQHEAMDEVLAQHEAVHEPKDIFGGRELKKRIMEKIVKEKAKEFIHDVDPRQRAKMGLPQGTNKWDAKKYAKEVIKSLPNTISQSSYNMYEVKKRIKQIDKFEKPAAHRDYNSKEMWRLKGLRTFLSKYLLGRGK